MAEIRKALAGDRTTVATALGSAFAEDPIMRWLTGVEDCERRGAPFWRSIAAANARDRDHEVWLSEDGDAVAVWHRPGWKLPPAELVRAFPAVARAARRRLPQAFKLLAAMEKAHPEEPHYYLEFLGTRRDRQGKGAGSAVLSATLERWDAEGRPSYLENSNPRNTPFYARHGFRELGLVEGPKGCPPLLRMWREPRS